MARLTYDPRRLEWATSFAYSRAVASLLRRFAGVRPGMRIVELGCGTGFWGRLLAEGLRGRGALVGIDLDRALLARARALARAAGLSRATYRLGDAARTALRAASADIVTCHRLLCTVANPEEIVREMVRVARRGGRIVANEHDHSADVFWEPRDPGLAALADERNAAWVRGFRKLAGGDHAIGTRLPELLLAAGVREVRLEGLLAPSGPQPFDGRTPRRDAVAYFAWLRDDLARGNPQRARFYRAGGWTAADERGYARRMIAAIDRALEGPDGLGRWGRVALVPRVVVRGTTP